MYARVEDCIPMSKGKWMVELKIDQPGLKVNTILSSLESGVRWTVLNRVVYAQLRNLHKQFPFEKLEVIRLNIPDSAIEELKVDLYRRENAGIYQYIIKGTISGGPPKLKEELLCAGY